MGKLKPGLEQLGAGWDILGLEPPCSDSFLNLTSLSLR